MTALKKKRNIALALVAVVIVAIGLIGWALVQPASAKPGYTCNPDPGHGNPGCHVSVTTAPPTTKPPAPTTTKPPATTTTKRPATATTRAPAPTTTNAPRPATNATTTLTTGTETSTTTLLVPTASSELPTTTVMEPSTTTLAPSTSTSESSTTTDVSGLIAGSADTGAGPGGGLTAGWTAVLVGLAALAVAGWGAMAIKWVGSRRASRGAGAATADPLRFVLAERLAHWLYACCFLAAGVTGALMWIPATAQWMAGTYFTVSRYHGYLGLAMVVVPLLVFLVLDRRRLAENRRTLDEWSANDRRWLRTAFTGGMFRGKKLPPQGRFNAGQKLNSHLVAGLAFGFVVTGSLLMARSELPVWLTSGILFSHKILAVSAAALVFGHVAMALLTRHGRGGLKAMVWGLLPAKIAREGHSLWYAEWLSQNRREREELSVGSNEAGRPVASAPPSS